MFYIMWINFKEDQESHGFQSVDTYRDALSQFHGNIAASLDDEDVTYCGVYLINESGINVVDPFIYNNLRDEDGEKIAPFENVVLHLTTDWDNEITNEIEYMDSREALRTYFELCVNDLDNKDLQSHLVFIVNSEGGVVEARGFVRPAETTSNEELDTTDTMSS